MLNLEIVAALMRAHTLAVVKDVTRGYNSTRPGIKDWRTLDMVQDTVDALPSGVHRAAHKIVMAQPALGPAC